MQTATVSKSSESLALSDPLRPLARLVGAWRGEGTCRLGDQSAPIRMEWTFEAGTAGYAIDGTLVVLGIPGVERCEQRDLIGYDAVERKLRWVSICNSGEFHDQRGSIDATALVVSDAHQRLRVRFTDDGRLAIDLSADGMSAEAVLSR